MDNKKLIEIETELEAYNGEDRIITAYDYIKETKDEPDNEVFLMSGFPTLDFSIDSFEGGELTTISGLTGQGKTLLAQSLTYNFAKKGKLSCWFSFEVQPKKLFRKFGDELPNFTLPRRLQDKSFKWLDKKIWEAKVKHNIQAVFIDHLHFIVDMVSTHNMSLEIGSVMRSLKKIALFHNVAVFIIAHTGKTKITKDKNDLDIDDIRDCLPANQLVYVDGKRVKIQNIKLKANVISLGHHFKLQPDTVENIWKSGIKKIYKLTTKTGKEIECSEGHKFFATTMIGGKYGHSAGRGLKGWTELKNLKIGQKIATPRIYPDTQVETISKNKALILGWIIGDGHITKKYYVEITISTLEEANYLEGIVNREFSLRCKTKEYKNKNAFRVYLSNGIQSSKIPNLLTCWLKQMKFNPTGKNKYIPEIIFQQSRNIIAAFLSGLFQADGSAGKNGTGEFGKSFIITYHTISPELAKGVQHLLLRLGIVSFLRKQSLKSSGFRSKNSFIWSISIRGYDILRFKSSIGFLCKKQKDFLALIDGWTSNVRKKEKDIYFDKIKSIKYIGEKETFDLSVRGHHVSLRNNSFCVNDFLTHNSSFIAQEADNVLLIWRTNKHNEAMLKIAKDRKNGTFNKIIPLIKGEIFLREKELDER